jgi:HTH-type transcriptional regulator/antitoxin HigA
MNPIRTEADYKSALCKIERLWGAEEETPEGDRLDSLAMLVEAYEEMQFPIDLPER